MVEEKGEGGGWRGRWEGLGRRYAWFCLQETTAAFRVLEGRGEEQGGRGRVGRDAGSEWKRVRGMQAGERCKGSELACFRSGSLLCASSQSEAGLRVCKPSKLLRRNSSCKEGRATGRNSQKDGE